MRNGRFADLKHENGLFHIVSKSPLTEGSIVSFNSERVAEKHFEAIEKQDAGFRVGKGLKVSIGYFIKP